MFCTQYVSVWRNQILEAVSLVDTDDSDEEEVLLVALSEMQRLNKESIPNKRFDPREKTDEWYINNTR